MKRGKSTQKGKIKKSHRPVEPADKQPQPEEKPFDFGGIPMRDLKKNLGCG